MSHFPVLDRLGALDEIEAGREKRRTATKARRESRRQGWHEHNEERGGGILGDAFPPLDIVPGVVLDERMIQRSVLTVMPKSGPAATSAMGRIFAGLVPVDQAVRVPADGKAATSMIRAMLRVKIS